MLTDFQNSFAVRIRIRPNSPSVET